MSSKKFEKNCSGCQLSKEILCVNGGIIKLGGDWIINHYGGNEGFLGWIALQPLYHRMSLDELNNDELKWLGPNIKNIQNLLTKYWSEKFPQDPVERVYVVYFFESIFNEPKSNFHLHLHLIPRTKSMAELLREYSARKTTQVSRNIINAWEIPNITKKKQFPGIYRKDKEKIYELMIWIKEQIQ